MNINDMHIAVQQGVDKINSLQADSLLSQEIDIELNKSIMKFVNLKYGKNNIYQKGFEESQKRIDDLRSLVSSKEEFVYFQERRILKQYLGNLDLLYIERFSIPSDYLYHINSYCNVIESTKCKNTVPFILEELSEKKAVFRLGLDNLKVHDFRRIGESWEQILVGYISNIDIIRGATPASGVLDINTAILGSIGEVGGDAIFRNSIWDASTDDNLSSHIADYDYLNPVMNGGEFGPLTTVTVDKTSKNIIQDPNNVLEQYIIDSIVNTDIAGVNIFYGEYNGSSTPGVFMVEVDLNIWNYIITTETGNQIVDTLLTTGSSVNLTTGVIDSNTNSSQDSNDFVSVLLVEEDIEYTQTLLVTSTDADSGVTSYIANPPSTDFTNFETLYSNEAEVMSGLGISAFVNGLAILIQTPTYNILELNISGLKRWLDGDNWIVDTNLYEAVAGIGEEFPGISKPIVYVQHDDILGLLNDPFNKPTNDRLLGVFDTNHIFVYTLIPKVKNNGSDLTNVSILPYSIKLKYLRKPVTVSYSLGVSCDLPQHSHEEIVAMTISGILEGISDPRYKTHMSEVIKNE